MPVPTVTEVNEFKQDLDDAESIVNGFVTVSTRTGGDKQSLSQLLANIVHGSITTYSAAATYTDIDEWVEESGITYRPLPSALPIGPETFDANNWIVVQGFKLGDRLYPAVDDYDAVRAIPTGDLTTGTPLMVTDSGIRGHGVLTSDATANAITNITQANPAVVTYSGTDNWSNGDQIFIHDVSGMTEVNGNYYTVANIDTGANTFELSGVDSSAYTAYSSGGVISDDDGGTNIVIDTTWRWVRDYKGPVNVEWFGAVAGFATDSTTAINLAYTSSGENPCMINSAYRSTDSTEREYYGGGYIVSDVGGTIQPSYMSIGGIGGNINKTHYLVGAIPRASGGSFSLLDDASHTPLNMASVSEPDITTVRVTYDRATTKINSFIAAPDDALAPHGVTMGSDVGTSYANIKSFAPLTGIVSHTSGTASFTTTDLWSGEVGSNLTVSMPDDATVAVAHPTSVSNDMPVVSLIANNVDNGAFPIIDSVTASSVNISFYGDAAGYISYNGSVWSQGVTCNITDPTITWQAGSSSIRIDHGVTDSSGGTPIVSQFGPYLPRISSVSTTYFEVQFYDYSGTQITTQDSNMAFMYRRHLLVKCDWPSTAQVAFRRGPCILTTDCINGVAGNNIWALGVLEF